MTDRSYLHPAGAKLDEEVLSPEEWARLEAIPIDAEERAEIRELIRWFTKRYPTAKERLAYARRKFAEVARRPRSIRPAEP